MFALFGCLGTLAVAGLFLVYVHHREGLRERERRVRERVAYMLWVAANVAAD